MKKIIISILAVFLAFAFCIAASAESVSWYCKREKDHKQPRLDSNMAYIEKYGGYYIDKKHGDNSDEKVVYLTFDAGYENGNVEKILDIMKEENVTGAFFVLEHLISANPDLVCRMVTEGHTVCNHTASHKDMTRVSSIEEFEAELAKLERVYEECTGAQMAKFYRPPEGRFDEKTLKYANELGYKTIFWSLAYADWDNDKQPAPEDAMKKLSDNVHNGAVILLHPTSATNAQILGEFIRTLKAEGYRFGTLDELVGA